MVLEILAVKMSTFTQNQMALAFQCLKQPTATSVSTNQTHPVSTSSLGLSHRSSDLNEDAKATHPRCTTQASRHDLSKQSWATKLSRTSTTPQPMPLNVAKQLLYSDTPKSPKPSEEAHFHLWCPGHLSVSIHSLWMQVQIISSLFTKNRSVQHPQHQTPQPLF